MLFNSVAFLFLFLPALLSVFFLMGRYGQRSAAACLFIGSLFFYAWWSVLYVALLLASIVFNYWIGNLLARGSDVGSRRRLRLLAMGVCIDLAVLGYFKYVNFFVGTLNVALGTSYHLAKIILPLGISFFTFTQIAFLVDVARGKAREFNFIHYGLFVSYFPHLIAGPVLHHEEMMPQFEKASIYRASVKCITVGLTVFALGLFKKVVLADGIAPYVAPVFSAAELGEPLGLLQSWGGALAYTLQLYFDFSGYSDMAIGLSYMIGVRLPVNFNSPYKAANITDFWRRWHMTLSRFLRDYLYIPLGGSRKGPGRKYINLMATMLLGGLWHGAGWTFVMWGGLHGFYLIFHQTWQSMRRRAGFALSRPSLFGNTLGISITFLSVVAGWVLFRSATWRSAMSLFRAMIGLNGITVPDVFAMHIGRYASLLSNAGVVFTPGGGREFVMTVIWVAALLPIVFLAPNTQQIMERFRPSLNSAVDRGKEKARLTWFADWQWGLTMAFVLACGLLSLTRPSEFLYFQF